MNDELEFDLEFEDDFEFDSDTGLGNKDSLESFDVEEVSDEFDFEDDFEFESTSDTDLDGGVSSDTTNTDLSSKDSSESSDVEKTDLDGEGSFDATKTDLSSKDLSESSDVEKTDLGSKDSSESSDVEKTVSGSKKSSESFNKTKTKGSPLISKVIDIPITNILICLGLLMGVVAILGGVVMKHYDTTIVANNFGLKYEQEYYISSIDIGETISVKFQEYDSMGSPGQTVGFNYEYKSTNDAYYVLFKYYLKEGDIVLHTDQGMLDRKVVGGTEQDEIIEQNASIEQDEGSEE